MTAIDGGASADARLLDMWELTSGLARPWRELAILEQEGAGSIEDVARLPVGTRDGLILDLLRALFGPGLDADLSCLACDEHLELRLDVDQLRLPSARSAGGHEITVDGWSVDFRLPDSNAVDASREIDGDPAALLLKCCVERVRHADEAAGFEELPTAVQQALAARMAALDPQAEVLLDIACPACGHRWVALLDPVVFLLGLMEDRVLHIFFEVDQLARAYGWREVDVLAISPWRRRHYLDLVTQ